MNNLIHREINNHWCRLLLKATDEITFDIWDELITDLNNPTERHRDIAECMQFFGVTFKHSGIEIREGDGSFGFDKGKMYFVINSK